MSVDMSDDPRLQKAMKLLEAMCEPHAEGKPDPRKCRRCLAMCEAESASGHVLLGVILSALVALRTRLGEAEKDHQTALEDKDAAKAEVRDLRAQLDAADERMANVEAAWRAVSASLELADKDRDTTLARLAAAEAALACKRCHGAGWVWRHELDDTSDWDGSADDTQYMCPDCVRQRRCPKCQASAAAIEAEWSSRLSQEVEAAFREGVVRGYVSDSDMTTDDLNAAWLTSEARKRVRT